MHSILKFWSVAFLACCVFPAFSGAPARAGGKCVALTFDDGPHPTLTPKLLSILAQEHVHATFYVVGQRVAQWPGIVRRVYQQGNEIGNHSWSHPVLPKLSTARIKAEIAKTDEAVRRATGVIPATVRPPYGSISPRVRAAIGRRQIVMWDTDTLDWRYHDSKRIARVADRTRSGGMVLMHDIHPRTVAAVGGIIEYLKSRGFSFVTVSQLYRGGCGSGGGEA